MERDSSVTRRSACMAVLLSVGLCTSALGQGLGRWVSGAPMPSERSEVAVAAVEGRIYVVGGFDGQTELEVYDPSADRWTRGAPFPWAVHHAAAVGLDGKLWVIGGYIDGWTASDLVYEYDPGPARWRPRASMPTPRGALAAAVIDGPRSRVVRQGHNRLHAGRGALAFLLGVR